MKVYRFNDSLGSGGLIVKDPSDLIDHLECCEIGDNPYVIFVEEMSQEKLESLPEWDGF